MSCPTAACVRFLDDKYKDYYVLLRDVFLKRDSDVSIKPVDCDDYDKEKIYFIYWRTCKNNCTPNDKCCALYKEYIKCLGVDIDDVKEKSENSSKRLKFRKKFSSTESSSETSFENTAPNLENYFNAAKEQNVNLIKKSYMKNQIISNNRKRLSLDSNSSITNNQSNIIDSEIQTHFSNCKVLLTRQPLSRIENKTKESGAPVKTHTEARSPILSGVKRKYVKSTVIVKKNVPTVTDPSNHHCDLSSTQFDITPQDENDHPDDNMSSDNTRSINSTLPPEDQFNDDQSDVTDIISRMRRQNRNRTISSSSSSSINSTPNTSNTSVNNNDVEIIRNIPQNNDINNDEGALVHGDTDSEIDDTVALEDLNFPNLFKYHKKMYNYYKNCGLLNREVADQENPERYTLVDNRVFLGPNTYVDEDTWTIIQSKKLGIFQRDIAHVIFKNKLPYSCLSFGKTNKDTLDKPIKLCNPHKLELYMSIIKNHLDDDQRYTDLNSVKKSKYMIKALRDLGVQIRDERKKKKERLLRI